MPSGKSNGNFYQGKRVLVTGGSGFVGTHIVEELLKQGARVRVPVHRRPMMIKDDRIEIVKADLTRLEDGLSAAEGMDYVFHAAGAIAAAGVTAASPVGSMHAITANLVLTAQILEAAWSAGVQRFLVFSSSTGYPAADHPVREEELWTEPPHPVYFGYGWMRRYLERLSEFVVSKSQMKIALVRPTAVYGPRDDFDFATGHVIPALIRKAVERQNPYLVWGNGNEVRDFLHVRDLARGCLLALEKHAACDPVNIGYGKGVSIRQIVDLILKAAHYENAKVEYNHSKPTTIPFRMVDISKAKRLLGFEPKISLADGLKETLEWYQEMKSELFHV